VLARANVVFNGYWDQPDQTEMAVRDGWFHTGDGGSIAGDKSSTIVFPVPMDLLSSFVDLIGKRQPGG